MSAQNYANQGLNGFENYANQSVGVGGNLMNQGLSGLSGVGGTVSPNRVSEFFGRSGNNGQRAFGLTRGFEDKFSPNSDGTVSWKGISGVLQFFHKYPLGFVKGDWGRAVNQIIWNIILFVVIPGAIYGSMIKNGSLSVPDGIAEQTPNPYSQGFYFSIVTMTTLGFGDITPATVGGQVMVMFHILLFFLFNFIWTLEWDPTQMN